MTDNRDVRVAVIAASPLLRAGIDSVLAEYGFHCASSGSWDDYAEESAQVDVLVAQLGSGADSLERLDRLRRYGPVVVLTDDAVESVAVVEAGASGVVATEALGAVLAGAVRCSAAGLQVLPGGSRISKSKTPQRGSLSEDDLLCLKLLADGASVMAMAASMGYARSTMHQKLEALYAVLGCKNRSQAIAESVRRGLVD